VGVGAERPARVDDHLLQPVGPFAHGCQAPAPHIGVGGAERHEDAGTRVVESVPGEVGSGGAVHDRRADIADLPVPQGARSRELRGAEDGYQVRGEAGGRQCRTGRRSGCAGLRRCLLAEALGGAASPDAACARECCPTTLLSAV
jgi:hypothetical protein